MRRIPRVLKSFGTLVVLLVVLSPIVITVAGCSSNDEPVNDSQQLLGTILQISIRDGGYSTTLTDRAFERVAQIERRMSTSEDDYESTELLRVNRAAGEEAVSVSEDTFQVLQAALEFSRMTEGAFDVTIWPLVKLWAIGSGGTSVPPKDEIDAARQAVNYRLLKLDEEEQTIYLPESGMGVDVGAIAKGYAADEAARILREAGVKHALLDFGGNILVIGDKLDGTPWRIGVQRPDAERTRYLGIVTATDKTVVTSGPYERFFVEEGVRYHHILNAETGFPARNGIQQVTIIAERSIDADALSTATYVLGVEDGLSLVESLENVEAVFITEDQLVHMTSGAAEYFELSDEEFSLAQEAQE